jgi:hypothetical protein
MTLKTMTGPRPRSPAACETRSNVTNSAHRYVSQPECQAPHRRHVARSGSSRVRASLRLSAHPRLDAQRAIAKCECTKSDTLNRRCSFRVPPISRQCMANSG